jgi:hypothetical protein
MKCIAFASWLLLLQSANAQDTRSLLRAGKNDKVCTQSLLRGDHEQTLVTAIGRSRLYLTRYVFLPFVKFRLDLCSLLGNLPCLKRLHSR